MGRLAVVGGHNVLGSPFAADATPVPVEVEGGDGAPVVVHARDAGDYVFLQRHGPSTYRPPHLLDHVANLRALLDLGCDRVFAVGSSGSLRPEVGVGSVVSLSDFILLDPVVSTFADERGHQVPAFDPAWTRTAVDAWNAATSIEMAEGYVYWQTTGPRFETAAEVRLIAQFADVVGMTLASECTVAGELGLTYAAVCVVDNLANGIQDRALTAAGFDAGTLANQTATVAILERVAAALA